MAPRLGQQGAHSAGQAGTKIENHLSLALLGKKHKSVARQSAPGLASNGAPAFQYKLAVTTPPPTFRVSSHALPTFCTDLKDFGSRPLCFFLALALRCFFAFLLDFHWSVGSKGPQVSADSNVEVAKLGRCGFGTAGRQLPIVETALALAKYSTA
jgi:hypothetical protein